MCLCYDRKLHQHLRCRTAACVPPPSRRDRARRARRVPSALCGRPPRLRWRRAAPSKQSAAAGASPSRETSAPRAVRALQPPSPAAPAEGGAERPHCVPAPARRESRDRGRRARRMPSALCGRPSQLRWHRLAPFFKLLCWPVYLLILFASPALHSSSVGAAVRDSESLARAQACGGARAEVTACRERSLHPRPGALSPPHPQAIEGGSSARGSPTAPRRCQPPTRG
jgi:hypothetical protein